MHLEAVRVLAPDATQAAVPSELRKALFFPLVRDPLGGALFRFGHLLSLSAGGLGAAGVSGASAGAFLGGSARLGVVRAGSARSAEVSACARPPLPMIYSVARWLCSFLWG